MPCSWNQATSARQNTAMFNYIGDGSTLLANRGSCSQSSATSSAGVERPLFSEDLQPPPGFGKLSTVYDQPRGYTPQDGVDSFVIARSGAMAGTANHGIDRSNDDEVEKSRKVPLTHPEFETYYNYEGRRFKDLTALEKRQLEMAVHYPNIRDGIMKAPFYFRTGALALSEATQSDPVKQIFGTREIFEKIFAHLIPRYEDLASLSGASQFTAHTVQSSWMHLDATGIDFLGWDEDCLADVREAEAREEKKRSARKGKAKIVRTRTFSSTVLISPVRPEDQGPGLKVTTNGAGYPLNSSVKAPAKTKFAVSMIAHYKLLHFSYLNGYAIKHLVLHGMPWVTVVALQRIVSRMPRLEALGVHQCFLLTFGDTQPLLRAINTINKDRLELTPTQPHIAADYSPFYYKGPPYKADGSGHMGEYGIVPEEKDWLDSQRAVPAQLLGIWSLCRRGRQDFFTPGTGFRAFLDRLPLPGMPNILKYIAAVSDFYNNKHHDRVDDPSLCGSNIYYFNGPDKPPAISQQLKHAMEITIWQDLIIACANRSVLEEQLRNWLVLRSKVTLQRCRECEIHLPAYFYTANVLAWREADVICHGCQLQANLVKSVWLLYRDRRTLAERIFRDKNGKELSLCKVLRRIEKSAREEVKAEFGREAKPARGAIYSLPGVVDVKFLKDANKLWQVLTVGIPVMLENTRENIEVINHTYHGLRFGQRLRESEEKDELERKALWYEAQLGINQRKSNDGSLEATCLSWERLIRENRADIAIRSGWFVNRGPMHILNFRANAISMLGRLGGLPEYWKGESDEESSATSNSQNGGSTLSGTSSSQISPPPGTYIPHYYPYIPCRTQPEPQAGTPPGSPTQVFMSAGTYPHDSVVQQRTPSAQNASQQMWESYGPGASSSSTPSRQGPTTATLPPSTNVNVLQEQRAQTSPQQSSKNLLPHQRQPQTTTQPIENVPQQTQSSQANSQSSQSLLPHQRRPQLAAQPVENVPQRTQPVQAAAQPSETLLPHQRRPQKRSQPVQDAPQHTQPAQMVSQKSQKLLPHQRRPQTRAQTAQNIPQRIQLELAVAQSQQKLFLHQRQPNMAPQPIDHILEPAQPEQAAAGHSEQKLLPHQRRSQRVSQRTQTSPTTSPFPSPPCPQQEPPQPTAQPSEALRAEITEWKEKFDAISDEWEKVLAEYEEWRKGAVQKIKLEEEEADAAITAKKTGIPPPPRWLVNAAAASRSSPHQGWVRMLASWESAHHGGWEV
ncbi:hypothetical protein F4782DRAFT_546409 [Xylaria castorea]|nr:hypothetical protein F4782DRAFT_546409 [Xylaria castorea]